MKVRSYCQGEVKLSAALGLTVNVQFCVGFGSGRGWYSGLESVSGYGSRARLGLSVQGEHDVHCQGQLSQCGVYFLLLLELRPPTFTSLSCIYTHLGNLRYSSLVRSVRLITSTKPFCSVRQDFHRLEHGHFEGWALFYLSVIVKFKVKDGSRCGHWPRWGWWSP